MVANCSWVGEMQREVFGVPGVVDSTVADGEPGMGKFSVAGGVAGVGNSPVTGDVAEVRKSPVAVGKVSATVGFGLAGGWVPVIALDTIVPT